MGSKRGDGAEKKRMAWHRSGEDEQQLILQLSRADKAAGILMLWRVANAISVFPFGNREFGGGCLSGSL
jgi:hypothetical protein